MCGRFSLTAEPEELEAFFALLEVEDFPPRYNIAPTQPILLVIAGNGREPGSNLPDRRAMLARWGLIPGWTKDPNDLPAHFNARSETAAEKASFKTAMRHRRVLIPASGFYEWRRDGQQAVAGLLGEAEAWRHRRLRRADGDLRRAGRLGGRYRRDPDHGRERRHRPHPRPHAGGDQA